eukprot:170875_1
MIRECHSARVLPLQFSLDRDALINGRTPPLDSRIDLVTMETVRLEDSIGYIVTREPFAPSHAEFRNACAAREDLIEQLSQCDGELVEAFLQASLHSAPPGRDDRLPAVSAGSTGNHCADYPCGGRWVEAARPEEEERRAGGAGDWRRYRSIVHRVPMYF